MRANEEQVQLLEEALAALPEGEDTHLRAMVTARLGLVIVYGTDVPDPTALRRSLALSNDAVAMARRLGDRVALGYALNARMHALWGIGPAPERLATGTELGEIADDIGDELLALHGHMWRIRELLAQGDVDAVNEEIARFRARDTGPVHPLEASYAFNVTAMMALLEGDFETAEQLGQRALEVAEGHNELALSFYGALMLWTWWQRGDLAAPDAAFREVLAQAPAEYPTVSAALALVHAEAGDTEAALGHLRVAGGARMGERGGRPDRGRVARHGGRGLRRARRAGAATSRRRSTRRCGPMPAPPSWSVPRPRRAWGRPTTISACLAGTMGDLALAEVHHEAALRLARRMGSPPFVAAAEVELARTLRQRRPTGDEERVAVLLRSAEESALAMGLHRLAQLAAEPGLTQPSVRRGVPAG